MMNQEANTAHSACLAYYGVSAPSQVIVDALEEFTKGTIGEVVEISKDALMQGYVPPSITLSPFIILAFHKGQQDNVTEDCYNYVQRTIGKTVLGAVWLDVQGEWQQIGRDQWLDEWILDAPVPQSDGLHWTVEIRDKKPGAQWERMESGWESPNQFDDEGVAEVVARSLAIRHDSDMDTRVVSPRGVVLSTYRVQKYLATRRRAAFEYHVELSPTDRLLMLQDAVALYRRERAGKSAS